ncbi:MAG: hypothetical protein AMXMBFR20_19980 [Planctomycetia bacterium]
MGEVRFVAIKADHPEGRIGLEKQFGVAAKTEGAIDQKGRLVRQQKIADLVRQDGDVRRLVTWL